LYLAHGVQHAGYDLLADARQHYLGWGAMAKVDQLDWAYPVLRPPHATADHREQVADRAQRGPTVTTGVIDMLGILSASQALSSETDIEGLHARVAEVLSAMSGATDVRLLLWSDERQDWLMPAPGLDTAVPMSVLRYVQRTREPLVVGDATRDDRFARDPYFIDVTCCSLLAVPVLSRGILQAVLLLENRLMRGAFTERLDAVQLIAGQLAVSLDNAHVYAEFRQIADDQAALRRVATLVARGVEPSEVFAAVTEELRRTTHELTAGLWRYETTGEITLLAASAADPALLAKWPVGTRTTLEGDNLASRILRTCRPARMDAYEAAHGSIAERVRQLGNRAAVGVPVIVDGRLWGLAAVSSSKPGPMPFDTEARMNDFAELVATAIANAATRDELQASRDSLAELATQQSALRRVATLIAQGASPSQVFSVVAEEMARCLSTGNAGIGRFEGDEVVLLAVSRFDPDMKNLPVVGQRFALDGDNFVTRVFRTGAPARVDSSESQNAPGPIAARVRELGLGCTVAVPILVDGHVWGTATVGATEPLPPDTEARIGDFADLVATAIANAATRAELIASPARIVAAADDARRRIERDLHDGAQQRLVALGLELRAAEACVPDELQPLRERLAGLVTTAAAVSAEVQEISRGIHPAILSRDGLGPALKTLARRCTVPVDLDLHVDRRFADSVEVGAYYVVAEALTNAAKHARASVVEVCAHATGRTLRLEIRDDGIGGAAAGNGSGLIGLVDRVEALGGKMTVQSPAGSGTSLLVDIPLDTT